MPKKSSKTPKFAIFSRILGLFSSPNRPKAYFLTPPPATLPLNYIHPWPTLRFLRRKKIRTIVDFKISLFIKGQANVSIIIPNPKVF